MEINFEWDSKELERQLTELAGDEALRKVTNSTLKAIGNKIHQYCKGKLRVSKDNSRSGKKGSRPKGHSKDNIPISGIKEVNKDDFSYIIVGWEKGDTSPWFYNKFQEWGTSKILPNPVFSVAKQLYENELDELYRSNLEKELKKRLGG